MRHHDRQRGLEANEGRKKNNGISGEEKKDDMGCAARKRYAWRKYFDKLDRRQNNAWRQREGKCRDVRIADNDVVAVSVSLLLNAARHFCRGRFVSFQRWLNYQRDGVFCSSTDKFSTW